MQKIFKNNKFILLIIQRNLSGKVLHIYSLLLLFFHIDLSKNIFIIKNQTQTQQKEIEKIKICSGMMGIWWRAVQKIVWHMPRYSNMFNKCMISHFQMPWYTTLYKYIIYSHTLNVSHSYVSVMCVVTVQ